MTALHHKVIAADVAVTTASAQHRPRRRKTRWVVPYLFLIAAAVAYFGCRML